MNIGVQIKRIRKSKGVSQKDFAKSIGLSQVHYCAVENDKRATTMEVLEKIATATDTRLIVAFIDK